MKDRQVTYKYQKQNFKSVIQRLSSTFWVSVTVPSISTIIVLKNRIVAARILFIGDPATIGSGQSILYDLKYYWLRLRPGRYSIGDPAGKKE
jgi:hypothetical protein